MKNASGCTVGVLHKRLERGEGGEPRDPVNDVGVMGHVTARGGHGTVADDVVGVGVGGIHEVPGSPCWRLSLNPGRGSTRWKERGNDACGRVGWSSDASTSA